MHLGALCMQLRAPISFFLLFGANSSPEKVQHAGPVGAAKVHFTARWHPLLGQRSF